jgi:uncharacterized paraquat-inducible protein A
LFETNFQKQHTIQGDEIMSKPQEEFGGKGGSGDVRGDENLFVCPECDAEHAFPGHKPGDKLMCPKCAIPLKAKYVK